MKLKLSDYAKMSEEEKSEALAKLVEASLKPATPEYLQELRDKVAAFEQEYNMTSQQMLENLYTPNINQEWISAVMLLRVLEK